MLPHEKEAERQAFREMSPKKKLQHFLTYYSVQTAAVAAVILCVIFLVWHFCFKPRNVNTFVAAVFNDMFPEDKKSAFCEKVRDLLDAHEPRQLVRVDDDFNLSTPQDQVRISVLTAAGEYSLIVASRETFQQLAGYGYFENLEDILSKETAAEYSTCFFRTPGRLDTESYSLDDIESGRGEPLNYGISLKDSKLWAELGGTLDDPIAGVPIQAGNLDNARIVLDALMK